MFCVLFFFFGALRLSLKSLVDKKERLDWKLTQKLFREGETISSIGLIVDISTYLATSAADWFFPLICFEWWCFLFELWYELSLEDDLCLFLSAIWKFLYFPANFLKNLHEVYTTEFLWLSFFNFSKSFSFPLSINTKLFFLRHLSFP